MKTGEIKNRIAKKEAEIVKIEARIEKWNNKKNENSFVKDKAPWYSPTPKEIKTMQDLINAKVKWAGGRYSIEEITQEINRHYQDWLKDCDTEIRRASNDKTAAKNTLNTYKNMLALAMEKESKPVIQIFKDFFEKWKGEINEYVEPLYKDYLDTDRQLCDLYNNRYTLLETMSAEDYKSKYDQLKQRNTSLLNDPWVRKKYEYLHYHTQTFDDFLNQYMEERYDELVCKVTKITGEITDVSKLYVGHDGSLNGVIIGDTGTAKIDTIIAGGYNIQCLHYRVLVHTVKGGE